MSDKDIFCINGHINTQSPEARRTYAVAAALEMIAASVSAAATRDRLGYEMDNLSKYADLIQAALENK